MKLAMSNIAWACHDDPAVLGLLKAQGFDGIELAPTKIWPNWQGADVASAVRYRQFLGDQGFAVPALQAVVFGKDFRLLDETPGVRQALLDHFKLVAELAQALGARAVVFGAPKCRDRGELSPEEAWRRAIAVFNRLGALFHAHDSCLCIEPVPSAYGCNFVQSAGEAWSLVTDTDSPGFGLHVDAAALHFAGESLADVVATTCMGMRHFHISEPDLVGFADAKVDHAAHLDVLRQGAYGHWCSVEVDANKHELRHTAEYIGQLWRHCHEAA